MNVNIYSCPNDDKDFTIDTEPEIRVVGNYDWNATRVSDSVKRLEEENKRLKQENKKLKEATDNLLQVQYALADNCSKYKR